MLYIFLNIIDYFKSYESSHLDGITKYSVSGEGVYFYILYKHDVLTNIWESNILLFLKSSLENHLSPDFFFLLELSLINLVIVPIPFKNCILCHSNTVTIILPWIASSQLGHSALANFLWQEMGL